MSAVRFKPLVLCVDDEPKVLEGIELNLRRKFRVLTATSGEEALEILAGEDSVAAILSDMRMPGMTGADLLARVRSERPEITRMLLTGQTDLDSAIRAVNEGQLFRFLTKPCPTEQLVTAFEGAVEYHQLQVAERELLESTLRGSVQALVDMLALANPEAFGRAVRVREMVRELCRDLGVERSWFIEVAAMMSQIGSVALSPGTTAKMYHGQSLTETELDEMARIPALLRAIIDDIPRLEPVAHVVEDFYRSVLDGIAPATPGGHMLRIAVDFDLLQARGIDEQEALDTMRGRTLYDRDLLATFARARGAALARQEIRELPFSEVPIGAALAEDLRTRDGALVAPRGYVITPSFVVRAESFRAAGVVEPVRVVLSAVAPDRTLVSLPL
ncbi:MAG: response regulator [Gemmatimonadetes bacterium]|nr:response regulator [Gemmatimonadota bacterium]